MDLLIGTAKGVYRAGGDAGPEAGKGLEGHSLRALKRVNGALLAGSDAGVFRSTDGGRNWQHCGIDRTMVWDFAVLPGSSTDVLAGTEPAGLFRSNDGGITWSELSNLMSTSGTETWGIGMSREAARARTLVVDPNNAERWWLGVEVGGIA